MTTRHTHFDPRLFAVLALLLALPRAAAAQITTATLVGTITDSSGAALPGAQVTARNVDTGLTRTVPSGTSATPTPASGSTPLPLPGTR